MRIINKINLQFCIIFLLIMLNACNSHVNHCENSKKMDFQSEISKEIINTTKNKSIQSDTEVLDIDTIFTSKKGFVLFNKIDGNKGFFSWGVKNNFLRKYDMIFFKNHFDLDRNKKFNLFNNYIKFDDYCGTGCFFSVLFPLNKSEKLKILYYPIYINEKKGIIVYGGNDSNVFLEIFDSKKNKIKKIYDKEIGDFYKAIPKIGAIDKIFIKDNNLVIQFFTPKKINKKRIFIKL